MSNYYKSIHRMLIVSCCLTPMTLPSIMYANSNLWPIATDPLFLAPPADPLLTILWDDSGSMLLETSPESTDYVNNAYPVSFSDAVYYATAWFSTSKTNSKNVRDPKKNALFFDPFKEYKPWIKSDGTFFPNATYTSLYKTPNKVHPDDLKILSSSSCKTTNLTKQVTPCYKYTYCDGVNNCTTNSSTKYWPGQFFYNGKSYNLKDTATTYATNWFYTGSPSIKTVNILPKAANWYTFYRDRKNVGKAALGYALQDIPDNVLIGFSTFSYANSNKNNPLLFSHKKFQGEDKKSLFDTIYNEDNAGSTPLREALLNVNEYVKNTDSLWFEGTAPLSCRRAYNIIISDGGWSSGTINFNKNSDGTSGSKITGVKGQEYTYNPNATGSFKDSYSATLADIAMEYWKNDIRPDIENTLYAPPEYKNPAFWQHIVTHSISLNDVVLTDPPSSWPNVISSSNSADRYLDLWHASLNTKGGYLNSTNFESLKNALSTFLNDASNLTSTVGFTNTGIINSNYNLDSNSKVFKTFFNPITWSGEVKGFLLDANGNIQIDDNNSAWEASTKLPTPNNREIIAMLKSGTSTVSKPFRWSSDFQTPLQSESVLNYFRGDRSNEGYQYNTGAKGLRLRSNPLGDFINAKPLFIGASPFNYNFDNYAAYKTSKINRTPVVYAASNAGFLHAFNANTGVELFAITTQPAVNKMYASSQNNYNHNYIFDGSPKPGDAYFSGAWNTILVTPMATGGQSVFSINVSTPELIKESAASTLSGNGFWQFDDSNDVDLGYTFASPVIARINSSSSTSSWAVILGNGYNNTEADGKVSTTGNAVLYVLNPANGAIIKKLDTGAGKSTDPQGLGRPNGLSSPTVIDFNNDGKSDFVYAGDIFGNIWKFDISNADNSKWTVKKLFANTNTTQSITTAPDVKRAPHGNGVIVYASTGRFLGETDKSGQTNSIYAILDNMTKTSINRTNLLAQTIDINITQNGLNNRVLSNNTIDWNQYFGWYIDLPANEMVINRPKLSQGYLLVSSYLPDPNKTVCKNDQKGYLYAINAINGGQLNDSIIDTNNDNLIDNNDLVNGNKVSAIEVKTEFNSEPIIMKLDNSRNMIMMNTQDGKILPVVTKRNYAEPERRSWKKVRDTSTENSQ